MRAAEDGLQAEFALEHRGFAREAGDIQAGAILHLHAEDGLAVLDVHIHAADHAAMLAFQALGDAQQRDEHAGVFAASAIERGVRFVVHLRLGAAIVIADDCGNHILTPAAQAGNVAEADQIFAVAMMQLVTDSVAHIVENGAQLEREALIGTHFVERAKLIEERDGEAADLLGVASVIIEAAREPFGAGAEAIGNAFLVSVRGQRLNIARP